MSKLLSKSLAACGFALAAASLLTVPAAFAADAKKPAKAAAKPVKAKAKAAPKEEAQEAIPDGPDADITDTVTADYNCELGNKVTIFANEKDESHIALRWKKRIHRLDKVGTTTGARRFENKTFGLIWIGIPAKGMLLDSKLNRQLANECKSADQEAGIAVTPKVEKQTDMPSAKVKVKVESIEPPAQALPPMTPAPVPAVTPVADPAPAPAVTPAPALTPAAAPVPALPPAAEPAPAATPAVEPAAPVTPALVPEPAPAKTAPI
ncbi:MAG: hypothetical protein V4693_02540 [Pseudomonadota bacterium]